MAYLSFKNIGKVFPGVKALDDISFDVEEGSAHALVGENGAGKSTLLKILSGAYFPSSGHLEIYNEKKVFNDTGDALDAGIAVIYQELHLVPEMTVAENLFLGHMPQKCGILNRSQMRSAARKQLALIGEDISPDTKLGSLSIAQRQMVEIAKALSRGAKIIAFDEPTSSLSDREIRKLFSIIEDLKKKGHVVLYVSHRMEEIFEICDSITIFRDGKHVKTFTDMSEVNHDIVVKNMVGREIKDIYGYRPREHKEPVLEINDFMGPGVVEPTSLSIRKGEILGLFGLVGAGRSELLRLVFGATRKTRGSVFIEGKKVKIKSPRDAIRKGLVFCPEDRKADGIIPVRSVLENLNISARRNHAYGGFVINEFWEKKNVTEQIDKLAIKTPSPQEQIVNLSGGNQQKVILSRWLSENIKVILLDEPTRGIDVGTKNEIYNIMYDLAEQGIGIIMISSDLPEILGASDRIAVMREGRFVKEFSREEANEENVLKAALPIDE